MEELNRMVNENVYIGVLKERYCFYLDVVESTQTVRVLSRVGCRVPSHCSAIGKTQLAYETPETIEEIIGRKELKKFTPNTISDKDRLMEHLTVVKEIGYAIDDEEWDEGVRCVGAPIFDYTRKVVGAISISAPSVRMTMDTVKKEYVPLIKKAVEELTQITGQKACLDAALAAGKALVWGQMASGGWRGYIDFSPEADKSNPQKADDAGSQNCPPAEVYIGELFSLNQGLFSL